MLRMGRAPAPEVTPSGGRKRPLVPYLLLLPGLLWLVLFFVAPLIGLFQTSTQTPSPTELETFIQSYRFSNYKDVLTEYWPQLFRSLTYAFAGTLASFVIGFPLAYGIAFKSGKWKNILLVLVVAPFFCNFILRTVAWKSILADEGFVAQFLKFFHLLPTGTSLNTGTFAVIAGLTYNFLPFMVLPIYASLERMDPRLIEAGADLYATPARVLRKVTLPLAMPGVVAGTLLTYIPMAGDYVNAELLGTTNNKMIGNVIQAKFIRLRDYPSASALSLILMAAIIVFVILYIKRTGTEELV